jgi:predicted phage terminase large subunit-like protein
VAEQLQPGIPAHARTNHRPGERTKWAITTLRALAADGSELWPGRGALENYRQIYNTNPAMFMSVFLQDPSAMRGELFREEWLRWWVPGDVVDQRGHTMPWVDPSTGATSDELIADGRAHKKLPVPGAIACWGMGVDLAASKKQTADYTSMAVGALSAQGDLFLDFVLRERLTIVESIKKFKELTAGRYKLKVAGVEEDLLELVMEQIQGLIGGAMLPWVPLELDRDKVRRAQPLRGAMQMGRFYLRYGAPWLAWYVPELLAFPGGVHDDVVDASSALFEVVRGWTPGTSTAAFEQLMEEIRTPGRYAALEGT